MDYLWEGLVQAGILITTFNPEVYQITWLTVQVSLGAILLASMAGIPLAVLLVESDFPGKESVITLVNTLMALPTVVVGLSVFAARRSEKYASTPLAGDTVFGGG